MKRLNELYPCDYDTEIKDIKINSKEIEKGDIFVCTTGVTRDRHDFIDEAIEKGASAIVVSKDIKASVPTIKVEDTNIELPLLASRFYDHPEDKLNIIAVTGTNGKTTVAQMIQDMLGNDICGYMGTNGIICSKFNQSIRNTTPDSDRLYKYFNSFVESGCKYLSIETSSEAYYRKRLDNLKYKVGIITNITEDHLNIHKTLENYISCKLELLKHIDKDGYAILNKDDKYFELEKENIVSNYLTYGRENADLIIKDYKLYNNKTDIVLEYKNSTYELESPALGEFNIYNLCAAILTLLTFNYEMTDIIERIKNIKTPDGRVQFLNYGQNYDIVLDYAHTPDAFYKLYDLLNGIKKGRLITLTGSAGGREKEKRGLMGKVVLDNSDYVIFTMDDPRYENVLDIIDDLTSISDKTNYEKIVDRKEAIYKALSIAKENDIILIAGKGTDNYMAIEDRYDPYNDKEVIDSYFNK